MRAVVALVVFTQLFNNFTMSNMSVCVPKKALDLFFVPLKTLNSEQVLRLIALNDVKLTRKSGARSAGRHMEDMDYEPITGAHLANMTLKGLSEFWMFHSIPGRGRFWELISQWQLTGLPANDYLQIIHCHDGRTAICCNTTIDLTTSSVRFVKRPRTEESERAEGLLVRMNAFNEDQFICPITRVTMIDPVICSDGYSYERVAIEQWLTSSRRSPSTNLALDNEVLRSNHALRSAIVSFQALIA